MQKKIRNTYIDIMKGILITFVVIGHLPFFDYNSRTLTLIYSFHMHAFLIIGGILSHINEKTRLSTILIKRIKNILIPYFAFYIISFFIIPTSSITNKMESILVVFKGIGDPVNAINLPLWFLTFYFSAMVIYETIEWIAYRIKILIFKNNNEKFPFVSLVTLTFITILIFISYKYARFYKMPRLPFNIEIACFCIGFVYIGKLLGQYVPKVFKEIKKNTTAIIIGSILITLLIILCIYTWYISSMHNGRIDLNARDYKNAFFMYINAILGFLILSYFSYFISMIPLIKNIFSVFGENSIYILAYHVPSAVVTYGLIIPLLPPVVGLYLSQNSPIAIVILTSFGLLLSLVFAKCTHFLT